MMPILHIVLGACLHLLTTGMHDLHLSRAAIHYNASQESFEVTVHIFIDDLEIAMTGDSPSYLRIATERERPEADSMIDLYLRQHLIVEADGQPLNWAFLGKEESDDLIAIWCYLEITNVRDPRKIRIQNSILTEVYDDQKNIVSFTSPTKKAFFLLDRKKQEAMIGL